MAISLLLSGGLMIFFVFSALGGIPIGIFAMLGTFALHISAVVACGGTYHH